MGSIFQKMFLSTPTQILSLLGYFFDWIFSKPFWLQAIQISNLVLSIYNVVASGPLLKLQQARSQELQNIYSQDGPGRTFNTTISNTPLFKENWAIGLGAVALLTQSIIANDYYSKTDSIINNTNIRLPTNSTEDPPKS